MDLLFWSCEVPKRLSGRPDVTTGIGCKIKVFCSLIKKYDRVGHVGHHGLHFTRECNVRTLPPALFVLGYERVGSALIAELLRCWSIVLLTPSCVCFLHFCKLARVAFRMLRKVSKQVLQ